MFIVFKASYYNWPCQIISYSYLADGIVSGIFFHYDIDFILTMQASYSCSFLICLILSGWFSWLLYKTTFWLKMLYI